MTVREYMEELAKLPQDALLISEVISSYNSKADDAFAATAEDLPIVGEKEVMLTTTIRHERGPKGGKRPRYEHLKTILEPGSYVLLPNWDRPWE
jgi:hypothetical protein